MTESDEKEAASGQTTEWILWGSAMLVVGFVLLFHFYVLKNQIWSTEQERLSSQAEAMRRNMAYQLGAVHSLLVNLRNNFATEMLSSEPVEQQMFKLASQRLEAQLSIMPGLRTIGIVNRGGTIVVSSRPAVVGMDFSHRDYFRAPRNGLDANTMYVGTPFKPYFGEAWTLSLSLVVLGPKGEFLGTVFAALEQDFFASLLASLNYSDDMWTAIAHGNGRQFMMMPHRDGMAGLDLSKPGSFFSRHIESGKSSNIFTGRVYATGEQRIMALTTISPSELKMDWPLVLAAGRDLAVVQVLWTKERMVVGVFYALFGLVSALLLARHQRRSRMYQARSRELASLVALERKRLAGIIEGTNAGTWEWCVQTGQTVFNERWAQIAGYTLEELAPISIDTWSSLAHPEDLESSNRLLEQHFAGKLDYYECEARVRHKSGEWVWVLDRGKVIEREADGTPVLMMGTHTDINELKHTQQQLQDSLVSLTRHNNELEQFSSVVSHDLRQPVRMIAGYMELLRHELGDSLCDDIERIVAATERGATRVDVMLQGLLEYASVGRTESFEQRVIIADIIADAQELMGIGVIPGGAKISVAAGTENVMIKANRDDLLRLFMNLIGNAIKYSRKDVPAEVSITVRQEGEHGCRVVVRDNGIGVDPKHIGRLFRMFQRLHPESEYGGSGIGLALCQKIVERYNGSIMLHSAGVGLGCTVTFILCDPENLSG